MEVSIYPYRDARPHIETDVFLADGVRIVGDVRIAEGSSIWYNSVIRGDVHWVRIGTMTNIQDLCMLHVTHDTHPLSVGSRVTVGHKATLHGCTVQDECLIGIGSTVLDGAVVESHAMVAAGAVVTPDTVVRSGMLYGGIPAKPLRELGEAEIEGFRASAERYYQYSRESRDAVQDRHNEEEWS
jgi:carbonic anhydrase/acetyltransferase-like protein (isoleucine patch superfamily)